MPTPQFLPTIEKSLPILNILSNLVDPSNVNGSAQLAETSYGENILRSAEGYGLYWSAVLELGESSNATEATRTIMADNICESVCMDCEIEVYTNCHPLGLHE